MILNQSWLTSTPIAHRGLHSELIMENSLAAFDAAVADYYAIELDVHLSLDGEVVVFHDWTLNRLTQEEGKVSSKTIRELKALSLPDGQQIPTLKEVLSLVDSRVPLLIEIKESRASNQITEKVMDTLSKYKGDVAIQSFNPFIVSWVRLHHPNVMCGQLSGDWEQERFLEKIRNGWFNRFVNHLNKPSFIGFNVDLIEHYPVIDVPLLAWTVRDLEQHKKADRYADNVIFE